MTVNGPRATSRRRTIAQEEERAWVSFYRRAKDATIASEVLEQLEADPEMKRDHLALYLCCREALRLQQAREARQQRIGQFVRWLFGGLFMRAPKAARDLAVACLPETRVEPANAQVQRMIAKNPKVRASRAAFQASAGAPAAPTGVDSVDAAPRVVQASG
ncbi:hypothetical protein [Acidovorax anthurii]|uniref:Uncharacterized protein n=2 Tax=Paracidovorax anthurii TaxID=78229 RepID=A0A328Z0Y2_9BURK|nr:hypothetical protein AX018_10325 [Paracidovorax anthurii]